MIVSAPPLVAMGLWTVKELASGSSLKGAGLSSGRGWLPFGMKEALRACIS